MTAFNGGKMEHVFKIVDNLYTEEYTSAEAERAMTQGKCYAKIDGQNHMAIKNEDGSFQLYTRLDSRTGERPDQCIDLPQGKNPSKYVSQQKSHAYFYKPTAEFTGKLERIYRPLYDKLSTFLRDKPSGFYSLEVVGKKFQQTPGVPEDAGVAVHAQQGLDICLRTYDEAREYLLEKVCVEGVIFEYEETFWKLRSDCFDKRCPYDQVKRGKIPVPNNLVKPVLL